MFTATYLQPSVHLPFTISWACFQSPRWLWNVANNPRPPGPTVQRGDQLKVKKIVLLVSSFQTVACTFKCILCLKSWRLWICWPPWPSGSKVLVSQVLKRICTYGPAAPMLVCHVPLLEMLPREVATSATSKHNISIGTPQKENKHAHFSTGSLHN